MFKIMARRLAFLITLALLLQFAFPGSAKSAGESAVEVKELNFVFVHGAGGNACAMQLLSDSIVE